MLFSTSRLYWRVIWCFSFTNVTGQAGGEAGGRQWGSQVAWSLPPVSCPPLASPAVYPLQCLHALHLHPHSVCTLWHLSPLPFVPTVTCPPPPICLPCGICSLEPVPPDICPPLWYPFSGSFASCLLSLRLPPALPLHPSHCCHPCLACHFLPTTDLPVTALAHAGALLWIGASNTEYVGPAQPNRSCSSSSSSSPGPGARARAASPIAWSGRGQRQETLYAPCPWPE